MPNYNYLVYYSLRKQKEYINFNDNLKKCRHPNSSNYRYSLEEWKDIEYDVVKMRLNIAFQFIISKILIHYESIVE